MIATMRDHCYFTYIMASRSHNLYVGVTGNLLVRAWQHREGVFEGFSKKYRCHRLVWFESSASIHGAIAREKQLKGWTRAKKFGLIEQMNPAWVDLSESWGEAAYTNTAGETADPSAAFRVTGKANAGPSTALRSAQDDKR